MAFRAGNDHPDAWSLTPECETEFARADIATSRREAMKALKAIDTPGDRLPRDRSLVRSHLLQAVAQLDKAAGYLDRERSR